MVKNLPAQEEGHGFDPWPGNIPHAADQLSLSASRTEVLSPRAQLCHKKSHQDEKSPRGSWRGAWLTGARAKPRSSADKRSQKWRKTAAAPRRLRSRGPWAQPLCATGNVPGPGMEPTSPALAGGHTPTMPPETHDACVFGFPSDSGRQRAPTAAPCALREVPVSYLSYPYCQQRVC